LICEKTRRNSYVKVTLFSVQTWVNLRIPKQKRLFKKKSLGIIFIEFTLVRRQGIEPRTLGLRDPCLLLRHSINCCYIKLATFLIIIPRDTQPDAPRQKILFPLTSPSTSNNKIFRLLAQKQKDFSLQSRYSDQEPQKPSPKSPESPDFPTALHETYPPSITCSVLAEIYTPLDKK